MLRFSFACLLALASSMAAFAQDADLDAREEDAFRAVTTLTGPSVVQIITTGGLDRVGKVLTGTAPTTGLIVSPDGYIISSAFNFASNPDTILVKLPDGRDFNNAKIVATDHSRMLTLLKIDGENLPIAKAAPKESIKVGQWAIALGRTYTNDYPNVSVGIVSALGRIGGKAIQTDAKVSPVNYGGPLVNVKGEVMGILVPLSMQATNEVAGVEWYDSGIGFAIPHTDILAKLDTLKAGTDLYPGRMGISFKSRDQLAGAAEIATVRPASPAADAGLKPGDLIVKVADQPIVRQAEVKNALGSRYAGETISVTVKRDDMEQSFDVTLTKELQAYDRPYLGILPQIAAVTEEPAEDDEEADNEDVEEVTAGGVEVRVVLPGSPAERAGIERRDIIVGLDGEAVTDRESLADLLSATSVGKPVTLSVKRGDEKDEIEVTPESYPDTVPEELATRAIPAADEGAARPELGRKTVAVEDWGREYWRYVPESYNPDAAYGLIVWLHPTNDSMEATVFRSWQRYCDRRGFILLAPKSEDFAAWTANDAEFIVNAIEKTAREYTIDPDRIVVQGYDTSGPFAAFVAGRNRELIAGVLLVRTPASGRLPETEPENSLSFYLYTGEGDPNRGKITKSVEALRKAKYPVVLNAAGMAGESYPEGNELDEMARWIDLLDRL